MTKEFKVIRIDDYAMVISDEEIKEGDWFSHTEISNKIYDTIISLCVYLSCDPQE